MQPKGPLRVLIKTMSLVVTILVLGVTALAGPKYKVLHALGNRTDGGALWGSLALDSKGSLYGTTSGGGNSGDGTVFELTPDSNGVWKETILHNFPAFPNDGGGPFGTPMFDTAGNLYAITYKGNLYGTESVSN